MSLIGAPKTCKSWMVMQLALSIAGGKPFLGMETIPGRVIIFDLELRLDNIRRRLRQVAKTMGATPRAPERVDFVSLKGKSISLKDIKTELLSHDEKYALVVLDPLYKALAGTDENSNGEMTEQFAILDAIAEEFVSLCWLSIMRRRAASSGNLTPMSAPVPVPSRAASMSTVRSSSKT